MGLAVSVGLLADLNVHDSEGAEWCRESFAKVNGVLAENNLPMHHEPEHLPAFCSRADADSYPYSFLHYLRRVYAYVVADPKWIATPFPEDAEPTEDNVLDSEMYMFSSHLLCHSDTEGFYLPIDFDEVIVDDTDQDRVLGGLVGSSYRLMDELILVAPSLGITLTDGQLSDAEATRINYDADTEEGLWIEKMVWICHYEAARLSIEHNTAISYH